MANREVKKLLAGFRRFQDRYYNSEKENLSKPLSAGQSPKTLMISCCDSRVDPALLTDASPGELFVVRNVANLIPPFEDGNGFHGVSAAIEFAVVNLKVANIIILGHRRCGGIHSLVTGTQVREDGFVSKWMKIADLAHQRILRRMPGADVDTICRACELESIVVSIENLNTFPFVQEALAQNSLQIMGIYFDLESGQLLTYDEFSRQFTQVEM